MEVSPPRIDGLSEDARCPSCGALVTADAEWCGQCFASLRKPDPVPYGEPDAKIGINVSEDPEPRLSWTCPACEQENDIELNRCERCGTSFAALMKADEVPVRVEPMEALKWSLIYPGLGHRKAGRGAEGVARGMAFSLSLILLVVVALSTHGSAGEVAMASLYFVTTITLYLGSAAEAYRIAAGGAPFVASRTLMWVTVGFLLVSIALLAITATVSARR